MFRRKRDKGVKIKHIESLSNMSHILYRMTGQYAAFYLDCLETGEFDLERAKKGN